MTALPSGASSSSTKRCERADADCAATSTRVVPRPVHPIRTCSNAGTRRRSGVPDWRSLVAHGLLPQVRPQRLLGGRLPSPEYPRVK